MSNITEGSIVKCKNLKCNNLANPSLGTGKYCSRSCANSRSRPPEIREKIRRGVLKTGAKRPPLNEQSLEKWKASIKKHWEEQYKSTPFGELGNDLKRRRVIEEQNECCANCGISEWKSLPITFELDHKDGNNYNNNRDNLWALCPNCHSLTETWRGRNKPRFNGEKKVEDDVLMEALTIEPNIRKALLRVGLAAKGNNYARAKALLENMSWSGQRA
jgi:RNA polymerase subunit RPABC4/transcription elongation factor Spt4